MSANLTTLSASLIAVGFLGATSAGFDETFFVFGAVVLAVVGVVMLLTFGPCVQRVHRT